MTDAPTEVRDRLLKAWEGEIIAGAVYDAFMFTDGTTAIVGGATYVVGLALPT